jgi:hypothetical protein
MILPAAWSVAARSDRSPGRTGEDRNTLVSGLKTAAQFLSCWSCLPQAGYNTLV